MSRPECLFAAVIGQRNIDPARKTIFAVPLRFAVSKKNELTLIEKDDGEIGVVVKERLAAVNGQVGPRFEADLAPPNDLEIDDALNVAAATRAASAFG